MSINCSREFRERFENAASNGSDTAKVVLRYLDGITDVPSFLIGRWRTKRIKHPHDEDDCRIVQEWDDNRAVYTTVDFVEMLQRHDAIVPQSYESLKEFDSFVRYGKRLGVELVRGEKAMQAAFEGYVATIEAIMPELRYRYSSTWARFYTRIAPCTGIAVVRDDAGVVIGFGIIWDNISLSNRSHSWRVKGSLIESECTTTRAVHRVLCKYATKHGIQAVRESQSGETCITCRSDDTRRYPEKYSRGPNAELVALYAEGAIYPEVQLNPDFSYQGGFPYIGGMRNVVLFNGSMYMTANSSHTWVSLGYPIGYSTFYKRRQICPGCGAVLYSNEPMCPTCSESATVKTCFGRVFTGKGRTVKGFGVLPDWYFVDGKLKPTAKTSIMFQRFCIPIDRLP